MGLAVKFDGPTPFEPEDYGSVGVVDADDVLVAPTPGAYLTTSTCSR